MKNEHHPTLLKSVIASQAFVLLLLAPVYVVLTVGIIQSNTSNSTSKAPQPIAELPQTGSSDTSSGEWQQVIGCSVFEQKFVYIQNQSQNKNVIGVTGNAGSEFYPISSEPNTISLIGPLNADVHAKWVMYNNVGASPLEFTGKFGQVDFDANCSTTTAFFEAANPSVKYQNQQLAEALIADLEAQVGFSSPSLLIMACNGPLKSADYKTVYILNSFTENVNLIFTGAMGEQIIVELEPGKTMRNIGLTFADSSTVDWSVVSASGDYMVHASGTVDADAANCRDIELLMNSSNAVVPQQRVIIR